jgi:DNA gyrase/topoisomerase IV subunit B
MKKYDESSIERFAGLLGIRKKPTPYIGPADGNGLWTILREPCDNAVDQALAGRNKALNIIFDPKPNTYWVTDAGEGIPVGIKTFHNEKGDKEKLSTLYVTTGLTHGGSNFSGDTISRGTHGLGIKTSNAMSTSFTVWSYRDSKWHCIEYKDAKLYKDVYISKPPKLPHGLKAKGGVVVNFTPDLSLFHKGSKLAIKDVIDWCTLTSYLVPNLTISLFNSKGQKKVFSTKGPQDYLKAKLEELKLNQMGKSFHFSSKEADLVLAFTDCEGPKVEGYTNGLWNKEGGEHLKAVIDSLYKSLDPYAGKAKFTRADVTDGVLGLVNYKISAPQFNNQPKDKLVDDRVYPIAYPQFLDAWQKFWAQNKSMAKDVVARASLLRSKTDDFLKDKKLVKSVNKAKKTVSVKLAQIQGKTPIEDREIFIVEGDSAGGGLKVARNKFTQAVYPLKGKPLNIADASKDKIANNVEIIGLLAALDVDLAGKVGSVPYGKIICLADSDVDGSHINVLLMGLLYTYLPKLFHEGKIYVVKAPLFRGKYKDKVYFGQTKEELYSRVGTKNVDVTYLKGWGELSPVDLGIAIDPSTRTLYQIQPPDKEGLVKFKALLGKDTKFRKQLLGVE